jgi:hypothetical protein
MKTSKIRFEPGPEFHSFVVDPRVVSLPVFENKHELFSRGDELVDFFMTAGEIEEILVADIQKFLGLPLMLREVRLAEAAQMVASVAFSEPVLGGGWFGGVMGRRGKSMGKMASGLVCKWMGSGCALLGYSDGDPESEIIVRQIMPKLALGKFSNGEAAVEFVPGR